MTLLHGIACHTMLEQVLAIDWNENVRETAVIQLANMTKADDAVAVDCLLKAIQA